MPRVRRFAVLALFINACSSEPAAPAPVTVPDAGVVAAAEVDAGISEPELRARVTRLKGSVSIKRGTGDDWLPGQQGMPLFENDKVRTSTGASAFLKFLNGAEVKVGADALLSITESKPSGPRTDMTLHKGSVDAELSNPREQTLIMKTPSATVKSGREIIFQ